MTARAHIVLAALALGAPAAHADAYEASLQASLVGGVARLGEHGTDQAPVVPTGGLAGRATYAWRDRWSLQAELSLLETSVARYEDMTVTVGGASVRPGAIERITHAARLSLGGELRFGYRLIPTLSVGVGPLIRWRAAGVYLPLGTTPDGFDDEISVDLAATVRAGFEVRLHRRWVFGASVGATQAVPLDGPAYQALEAYGQLAYFWYPLL